MTESVELEISVSVDDGDRNEIDDLTRLLKTELGQLKIDSIKDGSSGDAPAGTKAADWALIGNFVVTLAPSVIPPLFELLKSWINRQPATPVKIKIKVGKRTTQIEYDPTKTSVKDLELLIKTLEQPIKK